MRVRCTPLLASMAVVLTLASCHNADQRVDHPKVVNGVLTQDVTFFSNALKRQMPYRVFLPANIAVGQKLPVVYLLHGGGGNFRDWSNESDVAQYAARGLILVMPEGASSYYMNSAEKMEDRYEDYLTSDLISDVEARFHTATGRENRAVAGVSMGGFAAIKLAFTRPELFIFVGALSPAIDVPSRKFSLRRADQWWRFRTIFGPLGSKSRQSRDPFVLVQTVSPDVIPYLYITAGQQEALLDPNRRFAKRLSERSVPYEFHTKPGGHDWKEWDMQIPGCFKSLFLHLPAAR